jgi:aspartate kinase
MSKRVIVKFGGADLSNGSKVRKAAQMVKESGYDETVVVVSAMSSTTDTLISFLSEIGEVDSRDYSDVVSMGERTSARIFSSALRALGAKSTYFDPQQERWPIITDSDFTNAKPDLAETQKRLQENVEPLLEDCTPVFCGFLGKDMEGHVTTLGRGGSDITATLLGKYLRADEVILVKETEGILTADPRIVPEARPLTSLSVEEMFSLALAGAKIIRAEALKYKLPDQKLRVVDFSSGSLSSLGTEITGVFNSNPMEMRSYRGLTALTLVGSMDADHFRRLFSAFREEKILGVSTGGSSLTIFTQTETPDRLMRRLHNIRLFKSVSSREKVGALELVSPDFVDSPGWVAKISNALASKNINILEITSSKATISVFIDEENLDEALAMVKREVET